jgi:DNA-binding transcriptional LysR family regulator
VARAHPLARRRTLRLADLRDEQLILAPAGRAHRDFVGRALAAAGHAQRAPLEADGWPLMLKFAEMGLGVAIVNGICELPRGVVARPLPELGAVTYRLMSRRGAALPEAAERLRARIRAAAERVRAGPRAARARVATE